MVRKISALWKNGLKRAVALTVIAALLSMYVPVLRTDAEQVAVGSSATVVQVAGGGDSGYSVKSDGTLWATGINNRGQLGDGTTTISHTWKQVLTGVTQVAGGYDTGYAVKTDGSLWATGNNGNGQLGDGTITNSLSWKQVLTGVKQVAGGNGTGYALKADGTLWATGSNNYGQLGDGTTTDSHVWKQVLTGVAQVASGYSTGYAVKTDGSLWVTGYNSYGQLGDGTTTTSTTWKQVLTNVTRVAGGGNAGYAIRTDGSLWATGYNSFGQLGDGTTTSVNAWKQVLTGVAQVAGGGYSGYAVRTDGTLWAAGNGGNGQIGNGNTSNVRAWKQVLTGVAQVAGGGYNGYAVRTDGTLWATGAGSGGELGDGGITDVHQWETNPPVITASLPTSNWVQSESVSVSASDADSGIQKITNPDGTTTASGSESYPVTANGTYTFTATDNDGNTASKTVTVSNIDSIGPSIAATPASTAWTKGSVTVNVSASDSGSGLASIKNPDNTTTASGTETYNVSANGDYVFTATDNAGNATTATAHIANIDTAAPGLSFALAPSSGWTKGSVTITATGSDTGSGVASIRRPDGTTATGSTANYAVTANGTYSFTATDNAGNTTTQSVTVSNIDTTAPSLSCTPSTTAWTNGSVTLTASASDSQSGLASITKPDNSTSATSPTTYTAAANGTYTFSAADNAGNTTSLPMTVSNIDTTAPTSPVVTSSTTAWTNGNVTFTLGTSTDSQSGVAKRQYQIDGGAWTDYSSTVTVSTEGTHTIYARAVDNVGNISTVSNATVKIDKTAPTVPAISGAPSGWTSQTVNLMVSGSTDGASGIAYTRYQIDGGSWLDYTGPVSISADGAHTFTVHVGDTAGNFSTASAAVNIDKTAPAASGSLSPSANTTGPVAITVTGSDAGSGVASVKRPDETTAYGATATYTVTDNGTYTFIVTDNAGNTYTLPVTVGNIDKTVSVTLTSSVSYTVNPNNLSTPMTAEDITITNNSGFPIQVTLSSLTSSLSGTNGFWLGTKVREGTTGGGTWSQIDNSGVQYAGGASVVLGVLPAGATGHIQLISDLPSLKWPVLETDSGNAQLQFTASN